MIRKGLYLDDQDQQLITALMQRYGCASESQAVRLALRALAARPLFPPIKLPPPGKPGPQPKGKGKGKKK